MNVLVVNAGSSSLKYQLFDTTTDTVIAKGVCERIGIDGRIKHTRLLPTTVEFVQDIAMPDHTVATKCVVDALLSKDHGCVSSMDEIEAVGHRVVHGGAFFSQSVLLSEDVLAKLEQCYDFAPLHTPAAIQGIKGCCGVMPNTPQALVFDTAFHQTMPKEAFMYGLSYDVYEKYSIRRFGAHGTSHRYVAGEMAKLLNKPVEETKIVTCHIGNGSSISAVKGGKCIDTSMGFTPLAGILMGTRCGDIDPAIVPYLMNKTGYDADRINAYMNKECGLLGISGVGSDCRDVEAAINEGNERAKLSFDMLAYQIKKYIGSYSAAMGGLDAIVFTAGVGENNPYIRNGSCSGLEYLGVKMNAEVNLATYGKNGTTCISAEDSAVKVYMIPTNEELVIARDTEDLVKNA
jgi:acetate kinase